VLEVVLVSELVSALWFEDVGFLNEQLLDTPVGRFSIRQMGLLLFFGLLAWVMSLVFTDLALKVAVGGLVFFTGAALFTRKVKTVSPERHLFYLLNKYFRGVGQKRSVVSGVDQSLSEGLLLSAVLGVPVKVGGVLKDLSGKIYAGKAFKVTINNALHSMGVSDGEGYFCTYFTPDLLGVFQVEIQLEDSVVEVIQRITVHVNSNSEVKENAEKNSKNQI